MPRPNLLIVYPDQMRADALGCAGNAVLRTPNADRLAAEGVHFAQAYTAFPLCCPFRASLFTGKYPHAHGLCANHYPIPLGQPFLADLLRQVGYRTGYVGKWHLSGGHKHAYVPSGAGRLGFERFIGFSRGHQYLQPIFYRDSPEPLTAGRYEPELQTDHLLELLEGWRGHDSDPFFAMISYGPPHPPLSAPESVLARYAPAAVPLRANVPNEPAAQERARRFTAAYYGLVSSIDDCLGRILQYLDDTRLAEDTLLVFVSDHGEMAGEHGLYGKKSYYEGSMRVPLLVRYPRRFAGGRRLESLADPSVDLMPTLLQAAGIEVPAEVQGTSLLPVLDGEAASVREAVFYEICMEREGPERFPVPERGVRTRDWLYVRTPAGPKALFDLKRDPLECRDLSADAGLQPQRDRLEALLAAHMRSTADDWSIEAIFPPPDFETHGAGADRYRVLLERARWET